MLISWLWYDTAVCQMLPLEKTEQRIEGSSLCVILVTATCESKIISKNVNLLYFFIGSGRKNSGFHA